jgi:ABC-2 type transport system ATP-binding protein
MNDVVRVQNLCKSYGNLAAVDDISFQVHEGEIFGMVGPNGAGKTTTIECIEGLRRPDAGWVHLLGKDPWQNRLEIAGQVGIQLQESSLPSRLRVREALALFGSFYQRPVKAGDLIDRLGLSDKRSTAFQKLSGGQKQRLFIALALVNHPRVVFFDELTTGLDPQARHSMWDLVRRIRDDGCTVFLTTHFMEEAERLCDRVAILDHGRIIALDTPEALVRALGTQKRLVFSLPEGQAAPDLAVLPQVERTEFSGSRLVVYGHGERFASAVVYALEEAGTPFLDLRTEQPNLEDVFLCLTARELWE